MDGPDAEFCSGPGSDPFPPSLVYFGPFTPIRLPSTRRLSSNFSGPNRPVESTRRQLAYMSLRGRLVNAEEASSARAICRGGERGLSREEAAAWELFTPIQRFLIVAVIGVAVAESKKNAVIRQLKKSVDFRDQVLTNMQQKLDDLCEQLNNTKDQSGAESKLTDSIETKSHFRESFGSEEFKFNDCGCWLCDQHHHILHGEEEKPLAKASMDHELLNYTTNLGGNADREERRMSDLSDWCSSVTSAAEIQINNLAIDQDLYDLKKECQEKEATIKELTHVLQSTNKASSKRMSDLEETIRRKNMVITRLKKDVMILEQKVANLVRQRRPSSSSTANSNSKLPVMLENLLYDMDSTTSPSSSDSDTPPMTKPRAAIDKLLHVEPVKDQVSNSAKTDEPISVQPSVTPFKEQSWQPEPATPLEELSVNRRPGFGSVYSPRQSQVSSSRKDFKRARKPVQTGCKGSTGSTKRWV